MLPHRRSAAAGWMVAPLVVMAALTTPASAQFGGLKKKLKSAAAAPGSQAAPTESAAAADAPAGADAGMIVLTSDVVDRLLAGLQAGEAERARAGQEETPYGRYQRAQAAYATAQPKCAQAQQTFPQRMASNEKTMDKYNAIVNKMVEAQTRGDNATAAIYNDSAMTMMDPSCAVKQPQQPDGYCEAQRDLDSRIETETMKKSGFSRNQLGQVRERAEAILRGATPPGDASKVEQDALGARAGELKPLLGIRDAQPEARAAKPAPAPAPSPAPVPSQSAAASKGVALQECMSQNVQKHEAEVRALGKRAEAAKQAGNTAGVLAIADTLQRIQMAGCTGAR